MANIVSFPNAKKRRQRRSKSHTLCRNGHHKWQVDKTSKFDTLQGKLVTIKRCTRCGISKELLT